MSTPEASHALFHKAPYAVLVLNRDGQVMDLNEEAQKALAMAHDRIVGRPILAVVVPEDRDRVKEIFLRVLGGNERSWTARFKRGDAVTRVQTVSAVPIQGPERVDGILLFLQDMTESRGGRPETLQLQTLLENLPGQFVVVVDSHGRIRYSSGLSRTHFRNDAEVLGHLFTDLLQEDEINMEVLGSLREEIEAGHHWGGTLWHVRTDGQVFPARTYVSPHRDPRHGKVLGMLVSGRDVSVEYEWRERVDRSRRLAGIGELVASVSLEFRESLERVEAALSAHAAKSLDRVPGDVQEELTRAKAFAGALQDFSREVRLERRSVSIVDIVNEVVEAHRGRCVREGVELTVATPEGMPTVHGDAIQIRRVLEIFLDNALDAVAVGNEERRFIELVVDRHQDGAVVRVADSGPGVREEWLHKIFEPFFSTKSGRVGLGLAVAQGIVVAHSGRIWADRRQSDGAMVVAAEFPFQNPDSMVRFRPVPITLSRSRSVLVVDDEESIRRGIRRFLEKVGFDVREAWSGRSALAQLTVSRPPEIVLTDLKMSDGSGYWFLNQIIRDFPDLVKRTIIVTGDPDHVEVCRLAEKTGCPVLRKPLDLPHLLELLDEVTLRR
ncbi:MAG: PAS domain-containing protein [Gemmatimonadota bacterium]|nr:PAS domain-containing protein [Gemmatimonadota bacterium]MDH5758258.1 PAS domain-containing protein [Gemmatimonadota bacterium]